MDRLNPEHEMRFKKALGLLAITFMRDPKKELDDARVLRYWKQLEAFDIDVVESVCLHLEGKLRRFPLPVDIRDGCEVMQRKRANAIDRPNPRPPGDVAWCDHGCDDTGWLEVIKPLHELRDFVARDDAMADQVYRAMRRCSCWSVNPVRRWRAEQNQAGVVRFDEKPDYDPTRRGQLVPFRRQG